MERQREKERVRDRKIKSSTLLLKCVSS